MNKREIELECLKSLGIKNASYNRLTRRWDVRGDVDLLNPSFDYDEEDGIFGTHEDGRVRLPVKFGVVTGNFDCSFTCLETLEDAPGIVGGNFVIEYASLQSLKGGPKYVGKNYVCQGNQLTSLTGAATFVGDDFICSRNELNTFDCSSMTVCGNFIAKNNPVQSLDLLPCFVGKKLIFDIDQFVSKHTGDSMDLRQNLKKSCRRVAGEVVMGMRDNSPLDRSDVFQLRIPDQTVRDTLNNSIFG